MAAFLLRLLAPNISANLAPPCLPASLLLEWLPYGQTHISRRRGHRHGIEIFGGSGRQTPAGGLRPVSRIKTVAAAQLGSTAGKAIVLRLVPVDARAPG